MREEEGGRDTNTKSNERRGEDNIIKEKGMTQKGDEDREETREEEKVLQLLCYVVIVTMRVESYLLSSTINLYDPKVAIDCGPNIY